MQLLQKKCYLLCKPGFTTFKQLAFLMFLLTILFVQCKKNIPLPTQKECEEWFISTSSIKNPLVYQLQPEKVAEMLENACRYGQMQPRDNSAVLFDTAGIQYISGFYTPAIIEKNKRYPLIVYLHGGTGTTLNTKGERAWEMLKPLADRTPLFIASPSASRSSQWWTPTGISRIFQTLRYMSLYYPIDPLKVFLAGVSDGASGCYALANTASFPFAGFFAISGYGGIIASTGMKVHPENIRQRPIYNVNAGLDHLYPPRVVNSFLDYLESNGAQIIRKTYPREHHGFDYRDNEYDTLLTMVQTWDRVKLMGNFWNIVKGYPNMAPFCMNWKYMSGQNQASVTSHVSSDTLVIRSKGLRKFILRTEHPSEIKFIVCNESSIKPDSVKGKELLELKINYLKYSCFPVITESKYFSIVPK
ncbi:MAG: hypothetical protein JW915_11005 [Chitinispirillaceae bacterium]|nr:hypothetical protein [Chitinispirillaceae bacterium]